MSLINLLTNQAADGVGGGVVVGYDEDNPGLARIVSVQGKGTWNSATVTLESTNDPDASPSEWATVQYLNAGVMTDLEFTDDFIMNIYLSPGAGLRARLADSGSPLPSITVTALGHLASVA